jgi:uncharacterized membrane protein
MGMAKRYIIIAFIFCLFLTGCFGIQHIPKPTLTEQIVNDANSIWEKPLLATIMKTQGLPFVFILMIAGGSFCLVFFRSSDIGVRLGIALIGSGITGIVVASTYQRHAVTIANWSIVILISALCLGSLLLLILFYAKYIKTNTALKEVIASAIPAFDALREKVGDKVVKADAWKIQSDNTVNVVKKITKELAVEKAEQNIKE